MLRIACSGCQTVLQVQAKQAGAIVACPKCQTRLRVPAAASPSLAPPAAVPPHWHYVQDRKKFGPVTWAQLQELALTGRLQPTDMVLQEGSTHWVEAGSVSGLFAAAARSPVPPPLPTPSSAAEAAPATAEKASPLEKLKGVVEKLKGTANVLKDAHKWLLWAAGAGPVAIGLLGDFLRPLGPFNGILFLAALLASGSLVVLFLKKPRFFGPVLGSLCVLCLLATIGFGGWWGLGVVFGSRNRGFLGSTFKPIGGLQASVLTVRGESGVTTQQQLEGDKLAAEVRKQLESEKDATRLLTFAFKGYPANVIKAEVVGEPKRRRGSGSEPIVEYNLEIGVDLEQYETVVNKVLLPILEKVAIRKGEFLARSKPGSDYERHLLSTGAFDNDTQRRLAEAGGPLKVAPVLVFQQDRSGTGYPQGWWEGKPDPSEEMVIVVNTSRNGAHDKTTWKWYHVPRTPVFDLERREATVRVDVAFKKKDGQELNRDQVLLRGHGLPGVALEYDSNHRDTPVLISPYIIQYRSYGRTITSLQSLRFTQEELEQLSSIRCAVEPVAGGRN